MRLSDALFRKSGEGVNRQPLLQWQKATTGGGSSHRGMINDDEVVGLSQDLYRKVSQILQRSLFPMDVHFRVIKVISLGRRRQGRVASSVVPGCPNKSNLRRGLRLASAGPALSLVLH